MDDYAIDTALVTRRIADAVRDEYGGDDVSDDMFANIARIVSKALISARACGERDGARRRQREIAQALAVKAATMRDGEDGVSEAVDSVAEARAAAMLDGVE